MSRIAFVVVALALAVAGVRAAALTAAYILERGGVQRHHVESSAYLLAGVLLVTVLATLARPAVASPAGRSIGRAATVLVAIVPLVLYWPASSVGLLSDDFVLLSHARRFDLVPSDWGFVRPLPLAAWAVIARLGTADAIAPILHVLNVVLHAANAVLLLRVAGALGVERSAAAMAALIFAVFPLSVEAVAWASGVFDVALTTVALAATLFALSTPPAVARRHAAAAVGLGVAAFATKETAAALPILVAVAIAARGPTARRAYWMPALLLALTAIYVVVRMAAGYPSTIAAPDSGYAAKELLTRPFGVLAIPFHALRLGAARWPCVIAAAAIPLLLAGAGWRWWRSGVSAHAAVASVLWVLAGVAPLGTSMFVGPDLQNARYLYLPSAGWALLLSQALTSLRTDRLRVDLAAAGLLIGLFASATVFHLRLWTSAADARDRVLEAAVAAPDYCPPDGVMVPDTYAGAYVFRNGFAEALTIEGIAFMRAEDGAVIVGGCRFALPAAAPHADDERAGWRERPSDRFALNACPARTSCSLGEASRCAGDPSHRIGGCPQPVFSSPAAARESAPRSSSSPAGPATRSSSPAATRS